MYAENYATKRQSAAILSSAESDKRLMEALKNIEKLSVELESASYNHQQEVCLNGCLIVVIGRN
jgi:hypothetical protein